MKRGDIHWVDIPGRVPEGREIAKTRPCVVVSMTALNKIRVTVVVVPLTSNGKAAPPVAIPMRSAGHTSVAVCDQLFAVDRRRVRDRIGSLSAADLAGLDDGLRMLLGF